MENDLKQYTSQLVDKSFHFLMMSSAFNKHSLDRPGFEKLYRKISDKAWADAIELIKICEEDHNDYHLVDYLTGEFLEEQHQGQRDLAGKITMLSKLLRTNPKLGEFMFDKQNM